MSIEFNFECDACVGGVPGRRRALRVERLARP